jgi:predicted PurR-regulated permease PerM
VLRPLSTLPKVWQSLGAVFIGITLVLGVCFLLRDLVLTILFGLALIVIMKKLNNMYRQRMQKYHFSRVGELAYRTLLFLFWAGSIVFLFSSSMNELSVALQYESEETLHAGHLYDKLLAPYLPDWLTARVLTRDVVDDAAGRILDGMSVMLTHFIYAAMYAVLVYPIMLLAYLQKKLSLSALLALLPDSARARYTLMVRDMSDQLYGYFAARVIESVVVGSICCLGFFVAGVKGWLILGMLAGVLNIVDYIGPILSVVPPVIVSLLGDDPTAAGLAVAVVVIAQLVDNFYLVPFMISNQVKMSPLLTVLLILAGAHLFGLLGILFAVPVYLVYKIILVESYRELAKLYDPAAAPEDVGYA